MTSFPHELDAQRRKVAFVGTHGVGKTTLCFDLAAQLKRLDIGVDIVKEVARRCPLPINEHTTIDAQAWILHTQIAEEIAAAASYEVVICDRSVLDNYAYLVARVGRRPEFDALVASWVRSYDALFHVPMLSAPRFDGTRATSAAFQSEINAIINELITAFEVPVFPLDPDARDGWTSTAMQHLGLPREAPQIDLFVAPPPGGVNPSASAWGLIGAARVSGRPHDHIHLSSRPMIHHLLSAAVVAVSAYTLTQTHPLVGSWEMQLPGAVRMENGEQTITYVKGSLEVVLQGDSLIATLASEPVEGRPARPPARIAAKAATGPVTFTQRSEATLNMNGEEVKRTSVSTYVFTVTADDLKGTITRSIEGLDVAMAPVDISGKRTKK
jgi:nicotinamide riboside kinase